MNTGIPYDQKAYAAALTRASRNALPVIAGYDRMTLHHGYDGEMVHIGRPHDFSRARRLALLAFAFMVDDETAPKCLTQVYESASGDGGVVVIRLACQHISARELFEITESVKRALKCSGLTDFGVLFEFMPKETPPAV